jgi:hypothetical protein
MAKKVTTTSTSRTPSGGSKTTTTRSSPRKSVTKTVVKRPTGAVKSVVRVKSKTKNNKVKAKGVQNTSEDKYSKGGVKVKAKGKNRYGDQNKVKKVEITSKKANKVIKRKTK